MTAFTDALLGADPQDGLDHFAALAGLDRLVNLVEIVVADETIEGELAVEVELHDGGQPLYPYYFGLE